MPAKEELTMRQLRQMLRLAHDGVSAREIGRRLGVARSTVQDYLKRTAAAGLIWPLPEETSDEALSNRNNHPICTENEAEPNFSSNVHKV